VSAYLEQYDAYIVNGLPNNSQIFRVHIFSGDDDLGFHNLKVNEKFFWHFSKNFWNTTKFYGHFWWGDTKERSFAVFDQRISSKCGTARLDSNVCWWLVKEDGFYLADEVDPPPGDLTYMNWWINRTTI
jgi:hypothetical protein